MKAVDLIRKKKEAKKTMKAVDLLRTESPKETSEKKTSLIEHSKGDYAHK